MVNNFLKYQSKHTTTDDFEIYYETNFKKSELIESDYVIVFNYGLVCNFEHFKYQIEYFNKRNFKILIHDYRFHFKSSSKKNIKDCTLKGICSDLNQVLQKIGNPQIVQIGHSMGVNVCLEYTYNYPENVLGQILISGTYVPPQEVMFNTDIVSDIQPLLENAAKNNPKVNKFIWENNHKNVIAIKLVHLLGFHYKNVSSDFVKHYIKKIGELNPDLFFQLLNEMKDQDLGDELKEMKTKSLIMAGDKDFIIPIKFQKQLANKIIDSKFYIIKDGSHVPQVDFHATVNETIEYYLNNYFKSPSL